VLNQQLTAEWCFILRQYITFRDVTASEGKILITVIQLKKKKTWNGVVIVCLKQIKRRFLKY